jgi:hypothetical protein
MLLLVLIERQLYLKTQPVPRSKLYLGYRNQSVNAVEGNNSCLFSDPHKTQIHWAEPKIAECFARWYLV